MDDVGVARELARLAERMSGASDHKHTAGEVVDYARDQLGADHAGITLIRRRGRLETVAATDPVVERADRLQEELGEGPCHDSAWHCATLVSQDLAVEPRWPVWAPRAVELGLGSALGVELLDRAENRRLGSVNLFWGQPRTFSSDEVDLAHLISRHAALALASSLAVEGLTLALDGRKRIGQAQGILMERHGLTEDQAFAVLKRYSQDFNVKLRDLAEQLVITKRLPEVDAVTARVTAQEADEEEPGSRSRDRSGQRVDAHERQPQQHDREQTQPHPLDE